MSWESFVFDASSGFGICFLIPACCNAAAFQSVASWLIISCEILFQCLFTFFSFILFSNFLFWVWCHIVGLPHRAIFLTCQAISDAISVPQLQFGFTFCFSSKELTAVAFLSTLPFRYMLFVPCSVDYVVGLIYDEPCGTVRPPVIFSCYNAIWPSTFICIEEIQMQREEVCKACKYFCFHRK